MGGALSAISLAQSIESGNTLGILSSANALSGQAIGSPPQAQGDIHTVVDVNRHGGGTSATGVAHSVQSMLEQLVQSLNAQTLQQHPVTWMEITQPDGSVSHESLSQDDLAQRLLTLLPDNGGLTAQWLVDTPTDLQRNNAQRLVYCYTFDSCLRTSPMSQRPKSLASANDADWRKVA